MLPSGHLIGGEQPLLVIIECLRRLRAPFFADGAQEQAGRPRHKLH